jgi:TPR repeat protein
VIFVGYFLRYTAQLICRCAHAKPTKEQTMNTITRRVGRTLPGFLTLPVLLASMWPHLSMAQATAPAPAAPAPGSVVVTGTRGAGGYDPHNINAAKNKILSGKHASSCGFMGPTPPGFDDVAIGYMRDFGMEDGMSNTDVTVVTESAPTGDVSNAKDSSSLDGFIPGPAGSERQTVGCGPADLRFAAGRNHIERKDKSLALAFEAFDNQDYARALALFDTAWSKVGYEEAALMLARLHLYGLGTPKDTPRAIVWLRKVAEGRFDPSRDRMPFDPAHPQLMNERIEASFMLARIHERGLGVSKDPAQVRAWYAKAADYGFVPALDMLGTSWMSGTGAARDPAKGVAYLKEAAEAGYVPAQYHLGAAWYSGEAGARDLTLAGAWFAAAAKKGHPGALFAAGRMIDLGEGVAADPKRALVYYKEAALKGDRDAQFALGTFFYSGEMVPKDVATARKLFDAAARQGQADAMFNLGAMAASGEGGPKDLAQAYVWFSLADAAGYQGARAALKSVSPLLSAQEHARAEAILKPAAKKAG